MAAISNVSQVVYSHNSTVPRHGVVTLYGYDIKVRVDRGHLLLDDGIGSERRQFRLARVGHGLRRLVVIGADGFVSLAALRWLADQDASFVMLERDGRVLASTGPVRPSDVRLRRAQALAHSSDAALRISRELIRQKLAGQEQVARFKLRESRTADEISRFTTELPKADSIASIRLIEAQAALAYWSAWSTLPVNFPRNDLQRVPDHWRSFGSRISPLTGSPRLAVNPPNAILNYLYAMVETEALLAASSLGLDPGFGVLHADLKSRDSLACDLMEPVRPQVDAYFLDWIAGQLLRREWFFEERDGNARLMGSFATRLSETALTWRRAVAPVAEWVAQALWNSSKSCDHDRVFPTRLTQRRRSEGRGKQFAMRGIAPPKPVKICEVCGAEGVHNRYCKSCAVEVSRENMTRAALIGYAMPRTTRAKRQASKKLSNHAVANTWWDPSSLPTWLTKESYTAEVQPKLTTIKVGEIAEAIRVSHPYAALVRSGRKLPHARHWEVLAKLAKALPEE